MSAHSKAPIWITLEAVIAAGKSTLIDRLLPLLEEAGLPTTHVAEPVEEWERTGILARAYANPQVWNFPAQCHFFHTRIQAFRAGWAKATAAGSRIMLSERSPHSDRLFWDTQLALERVDPDLHPLYVDMWSMWKQLLMPAPEPALFIYLRPSLDACMTRMEERARAAEAGQVPRSYQETLRDLHDAEFSKARPDGVPVLMLETDANFRDSDEELRKLAQQIIEAIEKLK